MTEPSDRAKVIHVFAWIEYFLWVKIQNENAMPTRSRPPALEQMLSLAWNRHWISRDVHDDLQQLRSVRNRFAHSIDELTLSEGTLQAPLNTLKTPRREFHDWDQLGAASFEDGVMLFAGTKPDSAGDSLALGGLRFQIAIPVIVAVLVAEMKIPFTDTDGNRIIRLELPPHHHEKPAGTDQPHV